MPPKKKPNEPSKKTEQKKKDKIIEDKTFGLKNKKGSKQQKYVQMVQKQVQYGGNKSARQMEQERQEKEKAKLDKKKGKDELNQLFKPVQQKAAKGVDPKSVLCAFFKAGSCTKGDKCKFSHDMNVSRKGEKRNIYEDAKDDDDDDENKPQDGEEAKDGVDPNSLKERRKICRHFLEAVENNKFGWFWNCPNGTNCQWRHTLPAGFILNKDKKKEDPKDVVSLEELVETERASLNSNNLTRVTLTSFLKWKEAKRKERAEKEKEEAKKRKQDLTAGKTGGVSGREMFEFNPTLAGDDTNDDDEGVVMVTEREEDDDIGPVREVTLDSLAAEELECMKNIEGEAGQTEQNGPTANHNIAEADKLSMAAALTPEAATAEAISAAMAAVADGDQTPADAPIDENLFDGDDLDLVEDELENLDLSD